MKNYILTFVLAVFVVLVGLTLRQKLTVATPGHAQGVSVVASGSFPPPLPPRAR